MGEHKGVIRLQRRESKLIKNKICNHKRKEIGSYRMGCFDGCDVG